MHNLSKQGELPGDLGQLNNTPTTIRCRYGTFVDQLSFEYGLLNYWKPKETS